MKTPAGTECKFFYGDYYRGREHEECRLVGVTWKRSLCSTCPVPAINRANSCEYMNLKTEVIRSWLSAFKLRVKVTAFCDKTHRSGFDAYTGCGECHPIPSVFEVGK